MDAVAGDRNPPQAPCSYDHTPESLLAFTKASVQRSRGIIEKVCSSVSPEEATFDNALRPVALALNQAVADAQYAALFNQVSPDPAIRAAASEAIKLVHEAHVDNSSHEGLFYLVKSVVGKSQTLDPESQLYLEKKYQQLLDSGLGLDSADKRQRLKDLRNGINESIRIFMDNLTENKDCLWLTKLELTGLPDSTLNALEASADGAAVKLTFKRPDVTAILNYVRDESVRKKVYIAQNNVVKENIPVFKECLMLRDEMARLLGYRNFVEYAFQERMAESKESVETFLNDTASSLKPLAIQQLEALKDLKRRDYQSETGETRDKDIQIFYWDVDYYDRKLKEERCQVDQQKIAEYFPAQVAIRGMLDIFEKLFGIVIHQNASAAAELAWHPDVQLYDVWDDESEGGAFVGYLYIDIYPRPGKYGHNANFNISPGFTEEDGRRHHVSTALVCNLNRPTDDKPSLLTHRQVLSLFHELGHGMHDLLGLTKYARFHSFQVARDFVEMPSKMLEHFCWVPDVLQKMSRHYSYLSPEHRQAYFDENPNANGVLPPEKIPKGLVDSVAEAKNLTVPLEQLRQIALAKFDLEIYGQNSAEASAALDIAEVYNRTRAEAGLVSGPEALGLGLGHTWGHGHVQTSHFIWGNEACYYGYLYSGVFASDLYHTAFAHDPLNPDTGRRYRHMVPEKGSSQDEMKTVTEFLGRRPDVGGFRKELGLDISG